MFFRSEYGFSLPEILVTMVVLSVGLLAMAAVTTGVMKSNVLSSRMTTATALAQEKMEEVRNQDFASLCKHAGVVTEEYGSITRFPLFKRIVSIEEIGTPLDKIKEVTVTVYWNGDGRRMQLKAVVGE